MIKSTTGSKSKVALVGEFCLPTSTKAHFHEPQRGNAFKEGQVMYLLQATTEEGYPQAVVLAAEPGALEWEVGQEVDTRHAQVAKNLPPRYVAGIRFEDGSFEGTTPPKGLGLPHWELIPANEDGSASLAAINTVVERIGANKANAEAAREAVRAAKKTSK